MADNTTFKFGGTTYPVTSSTANTLLQDADPVVFYLLDFYAAMLATHVGTRLVAEAAAVGAPVASVVAYKVPLDPGPFLLEEGFQFPLLCIYRRTSQLNERTTQKRHVTTELVVEYILPPLTGGQAERIAPVLTAVERILDARTQQGYDPTYTPPGSTLGANVRALCGLETIGFKSTRFGAYAGSDDLTFLSWQGTIEVAELMGKAAGAFVQLAGADVALDLVTSGQAATGGNGTVTDFVDVATDITKPGPATG
jgi:hypothetical protein